MNFKTVLDEKRLEILPFFVHLPPTFYLSGGTALALQLKHRVSNDFDFFTAQPFDTQQLYEKLHYDIFKEYPLTIIQEAENTLDLLTKNHIKISFLRYRYPLIRPLHNTPYFQVADYLDIGASKLVAITQRATQKDYFDIYYLLEKSSLKELFETAQKKYPVFNPVIYLKALTYFDDCDTTAPDLLAKQVDFEEVQRVLTSEATALFDELTKNR